MRSGLLTVQFRQLEIELFITNKQKNKNKVIVHRLGSDLCIADGWG